MATTTMKQKLFDYIKFAGSSEIAELITVLGDKLKFDKNVLAEETLMTEIDRRADDLKTKKVKGIPREGVRKNLKY